MNRLLKTTFRFTAILLFVSIGLASASMAQGTGSSEEFKGSNAKDPRANLPAGFYDAGEASFGMKHVKLLKKPDAFQLGSDDADDPRVLKTLGLIGMGNAAQVPAAARLVMAQLAFSNSDLAFQDNYLFMGNFYGVSIYDISDPMNASLVTSMICPGGQGDVSIYKNLMFMSVEMTNGRLDCGTEGFSGDQGNNPGAAQKDRFRGVRIFDINDLRNPKQVAAVQTCRGSHTHTLVTDPNDSANVYIYVSGTSFVRSDQELAGCSGGPPDQNPETAQFRIDVIKVPVAAPQDSKVVSSPRIFENPETGEIAGLDDGGSHPERPGGEITAPSKTDQCHDITVYPEIGLAAGACSGNGILLDIKDPANPKRLDAVNDTNYAYWHSAAFSNDGKKVVFTDEWGGGLGPRCREDDPNVWGANALFHLENNKLKFDGYHKLPAAQGNNENCVAHNGSLVPVPGRDIKVQAWYQGGISLMDFTDPKNPMEIAYFDRGPIDDKAMLLGGHWSAYWYNGYIYASEMARGLDILKLKPTRYLTQNEIDAARSVKVPIFNVQHQERIAWPNKLVVAKAYVDQLERAKAMNSTQIADIRAAIANAEKSKLSSGDKSKLKSFVGSLKDMGRKAASSANAVRFSGLAEVLEDPSV
ncbi:MAG: hypothetical protein DWQ47_11600 [Acidobacteria bacterium]|nr:MAG: hypothetical protein DWQ32_14015 [Acidobacteriota bacterium]REJ98220.1 MAG: hypothetical protein DWQ38_16815 [Acidobacteriota bacterium]REK16964.1 MAG: hypothetical protein DWQ43_01860 [Acidobacteriota bacterium]REK42874.1 MAG: hypothetical protein DWQ47_11600 [Acidobacteriota bacterium]